MLFKNITGQEEIKRHLIQTVTENRISHAQLFLGAPGYGGLALAIAYARYICCTARTDGDACGTCASCVKYSKLIHPDLHFVFPIVKTAGSKKSVSDDFLSAWREMVLQSPYFNQQMWYKAIGVENKQGKIYVDESARIISKLSLKTFESEYKVMIIWMPERMNNYTANKLLKMIEEPPLKTLFLLVAEDSSRILPTILSRTQLLKIPRIDAESLEKALTVKYSLDSKTARNIVHLAEGDMLKAVEVAEKSEEIEFNRTKFREFMLCAFNKDVPGLMAFTDQMTTLGRERIREFFTYSLRLLRENFIFHFNEPSLNFLTDEEKEFTVKFSRFVNERNIFRMNEEFNTASYHIMANGYEKLILFDLGLKMMALLKK
jgi:DNA polymerase-3 subunit delta'